MAIVKRNIIVNLFGKGLSALLSVMFVPIYLKYLGPEAYGIVGIYALLLSVFMLADMGFSGTFTRETARLTIDKDSAQHVRDLCRTFEVIFIAIGFLSILVIFSLSKLISENWVNLDHLSVSVVANSISLMGIAIGLQFPFFIYQGGLLGMQRQIPLNALLLCMAFARGFGAVLILKYLDTSIQSFFIWQVVISAIQLIAGYFLVWSSLPPTTGKPRFNLSLVRPIWRFAAGTAGIAVTGMLLTQSDKLVLTRILPLEQFGYYAFASVVASIPLMVAMPFYNALYPRFTQLVAKKDFSELSDFYHLSCQALAVLLLPMGLSVIFFSKELILVWTGNFEIAQNTYLLVSLLTIGSTLMGLMLIPFALQLAFAWTRLGLYLNILAIITLIPAMVLLVFKYGVIGACFVWVALYMGQITVMIHLMHNRILKGEKLRWYIDDLAKPLIASLVVISMGRLLIKDSMPNLSVIIYIGLMFIFAILASAMSASLIRGFIIVKAISFRSSL